MKVKKEKLCDFVSKNGQIETAKKLKTSQVAISRALKSGREIYIYRIGNDFFGEEVKKFPSGSNTRSGKTVIS